MSGGNYSSSSLYSVTHLQVWSFGIR